MVLASWYWDENYHRSLSSFSLLSKYILVNGAVEGEKGEEAKQFSLTSSLVSRQSSLEFIPRGHFLKFKSY